MQDDILMPVDETLLGFGEHTHMHRVVAVDRNAPDQSVIVHADGSISFPYNPPIVSGVSSFNTRTGGVILQSADVTGALGFTPYSSANPNGYINGITGGMVTSALGYTPYNNSNPSAYISNITGLVTQGSNITVSGNGTVASPYVIAGTAGGVTSFNTRAGAITLTSSDVTTALGYTPEQSLWQRVSTTLSPFNSGDNIKTTGSIALGTAALANNGLVTTHTYTDPTAPAQEIIANATVSATTGTNIFQVNGLNAVAVVGASNTQNWTNINGFIGGQYNANIIAGAIGTISNMQSIKLGVNNNASGATITNASNIKMTAPTVTGAITNYAYIVAGTGSQTAGNYLIDAINVTYQSVLGGSLGLGSIPTHSLTFASSSTGSAFYNTSDQTINYERVREYWSGNVFNIGSESGGTGTARNINISGNISFGNMTANSVLFASTSGLLSQNNNNFYFQNSATTPTTLATNTNVALSVNVSGDFTGTDAMNAYGQYDAFLLNSQITNSLTGLNTDGAVPGYTVSSSRGTIASPAQLQANDMVGGFFGFGTQGASSPTYQNLGGMAITTIGSSTNNLGGQLNFYTKADGGSLVRTGILANGRLLITDGTQGLYVGAYSAGSGYGAIYSQAVTPGSANYSLATNSTSTLIQNPTGVTSIDMGTSRISVLGSVGLGTNAPTHGLTLNSTNTGIAYYNTSDQTVNYERIVESWISNVYTFTSAAGGTGTIRNFSFVGGGVTTTSLTTGGISVGSSGWAGSLGGAWTLARSSTAGTYTMFQLTGTSNASAGIADISIAITPILNQSGSAGYTGLLINPNESSVGSGAKLLIDGYNTSVSIFQVDNSGNVKMTKAGGGIYIKEGTNATMGTATLSGGTIVVSTTKVTASSRIFLTDQGGTITNLGSLYISARTAGTSFTISSTNVLDASTVGWVILEPA